MKEKRPINIEIGQRVQQYRESRNMTQEKLAELLNYSPNHLSALERGASSFPIEKLVQLCVILNVSPNEILFGNKTDGVSGPILCRLEELEAKQILFIERFIDLYIDSLKK